jgi:hypothetical protein
VNGLVPVTETRVEDMRRRSSESGQRARNEARLPANGDQQAAAELGQDAQRQRTATTGSKTLIRVAHGLFRPLC